MNHITIGEIVRGDREIFPPYLYEAYQSTRHWTHLSWDLAAPAQQRTEATGLRRLNPALFLLMERGYRLRISASQCLLAGCSTTS
jgi:hypothetical protein